MDIQKAERRMKLEVIGNELSNDDIITLKFLCRGVVSTEKLQSCTAGSTVMLEIATEGCDELVVEGLARARRMDLVSEFIEICTNKEFLLQVKENIPFLERSRFNEFKVILVLIAEDLTDDEDLKKLKDITTNIPKRGLSKVSTVLEFFSLLIKHEKLQPQTLDEELLKPMECLRITAWKMYSEQIAGFKERLSYREAEEREGSRIQPTAAEYVPMGVEIQQTNEENTGYGISGEIQETVPKVIEIEQNRDSPEEIVEIEHNRERLEENEHPETSVETECKGEHVLENLQPGAEQEHHYTDEERHPPNKVSGLDLINLTSYCTAEYNKIRYPTVSVSMKDSRTKPKRHRTYQQVKKVRLEEYRMTSNPRGKAVIFNIEKFNHAICHSTDQTCEDRSGSSVDADGIARVFRWLHFDVERYDDRECTKELIDARLRDLAFKTDHTHFDCIAIFILTHGKNGRLLDANKTLFDLEPLRKYFTASNCVTLAGKPKLFFVQGCKGSEQQGRINHLETDIVVVPQAPQPSASPPIPLQTPPSTPPCSTTTVQSPDEADFLICYSTPPGYVSYRDVEEGSWFISTFIETLKENCDSLDIFNILHRTNRILGNKTGSIQGVPCAQTLDIRSNLRGNLFLNFIPKT